MRLYGNGTAVTLLRLTAAEAADVPLEALHASLVEAVAAGDATEPQAAMLAALDYVDAVMADGHLFYLARAGTARAGVAADALAAFGLERHAAALRSAIAVVADRDAAGAVRGPAAADDADDRIELVESFGDGVLQSLAAADGLFYDDMTADDPEENPLLLLAAAVAARPGDFIETGPEAGE